MNTDWSVLTLGQQVRYLEVEEYVVLPGMLTPDQVAQLHTKLKPIPMESPDYTDKKKLITTSNGPVERLPSSSPTPL